MFQQHTLMGTPGQLVSGIRGYRIKEKYGDAENARKNLAGGYPQQGVQGVSIIIFIFIFILFHSFTPASQGTPYPSDVVPKMSPGVPFLATKMILQLLGNNYRVHSV